jgi:transcriptional regulator with XRE-family HTH domain
VKKSIGEKIRGYRQRTGLSQNELAKRVGVTRAVVTAWESGKACPKLDKLCPLANALKCTIAELVC